MSQEIDRHRKFARLMGVLYGVTVGIELQGDTVTYERLLKGMRLSCTPGELQEVIAELNRYHAIIEKVMSQE